MDLQLERSFTLAGLEKVREARDTTGGNRVGTGNLADRRGQRLRGLTSTRRSRGVVWFGGVGFGGGIRLVVTKELVCISMWISKASG